MSDAPVTTPSTIIERQLRPEDVGAAGFLKWMSVSMPKMYRDLLPDIRRLNTQAKAANLSGLGAFGDSGTTTLFDMGGNATTVPAGTAPASTSWSDNILKLIQGWGQYKLTNQQLDIAKQIAQTNLSRAQQGLAPIAYDAGQLGLAPTVNFGLSGTTGEFVKWSGIGFGVYLLLKLVTDHRGRTSR